jgi:hypothetical protein
MRGSAPERSVRDVPYFALVTAVLAYLSRRRVSLAADAPPAGLIECLVCHTDHVCPVEWEEVDDTHWWMRLRCGACGVWREVVATDEEAARLDSALSQHMASIERALVRLDLERMAADVDVLVLALDQDLIDPSSFCR